MAQAQPTDWWTDWQFWAASAIALGALAWLLRGVIARRTLGRRRASSTRVTLTIGGAKRGE